MLRSLKIVLFVVIGFLSTQIYAKTLKLNPKESKVLTNSGLWTVNATCNIQGTQKGKVRIKVLKNGGKVNGRFLSSGQATLISVRGNSSISVSAESGTEINLTNLSAQGLEAVCNT